MNAATEKHGLAAGVAGRPHSADWTVPQRWADYTADEHAVWKVLYERQTALLRGRACDEFVAGMQALPIAPDRIPDFAQLSEVLRRHTGWQIVAVPGLVPDEVFFEHLAHRRFPSGQFIRRADQLDYLEEPDVFHDVFGHAPMLMNPVIADFIQAYGEGGLRAQRLGTLAAAGARVLVHGGVRAGQTVRWPAHLRLRHRQLAHRERVLSGGRIRRTASASIWSA